MEDFRKNIHGLIEINDTTRSLEDRRNFAPLLIVNYFYSSLQL